MWMVEFHKAILFLRSFWQPSGGSLFLCSLWPPSGGLSPGEGWDAVTWCGWSKGRNYWYQGSRWLVNGLRSECWVIAGALPDFLKNYALETRRKSSILMVKLLMLGNNSQRVKVSSLFFFYFRLVLIAGSSPQKSLSARREQVPFSMAIGNGELMHECFPKHSRMGTAR